MPAPVVASVGSVLALGAGTSAAIPVPSGVAADEIIVVLLYLEQNRTVTAPSGFTALTGNPNATSQQWEHVYWKRATGGDSGTYSFTWTTSAARAGVALRISGAITTGSPIDVSNRAARSSNGTVTPAVSVTTTGADRLLIWLGTNYAAGSWTPPSSYTERVDSGEITAASREQASAGSSGSVTGTGTDSGQQTATLLAITSGVTITEKSSDDTGSGTDAAAVQRASEAVDTAAGTDATAVARSSTLADTGTGTDAASIISLTLKVSADTGTGTDTALVEVPTPVARTDTGTGTDAASITVAFSAADTGTGTDASALLRSTQRADTAAGTDAATVLRVNTIAESGTGDDAVVVVVLPDLTRPRSVVKRVPKYEVLVVARTPQPAGPPVLEVKGALAWSKVNYSSPLSKAQSSRTTCSRSSITETVAQRLRAPGRNPSEVWVLRNSVVVCAGPLLGVAPQGRDEVQFVAGGLMTYLDWMWLEQSVRYDQVDQFAIAADLVNRWQSAESGHFGIDTSLVGTSGRLRDQSYDRDEGHQVSRRITELGARRDGFDTEVDPETRQLRLWYPSKGIDRSVGEDAIVFDRRNIDDGDGMSAFGPGDLASESFGSGSSSGADAALWSAQSNLELRASFGRAGIFGSWSDVSEQATLDDHVAAQLDARAEPLRTPGRRVKVTPDSDLASYAEGDTVQYELDRLLGIGGAYRIRSRTVDVVQPGIESVDLEFM